MISMNDVQLTFNGGRTIIVPLIQHDDDVVCVPSSQ